MKDYLKISLDIYNRLLTGEYSIGQLVAFVLLSAFLVWLIYVFILLLICMIDITINPDDNY